MSLALDDNRGLTAQQLVRFMGVVAGTYSFPDDAGGAVTPSSGMTVSVAAIDGDAIRINGSTASDYAGGTVTADAADATLDRRDLVYINTAGTVAIKKGTAAAFPVQPDLASTEIAVAELFVGAGDTEIGSSEILDQRMTIASPAAPEAILPLFVGPSVSSTTATANRAYLAPIVPLAADFDLGSLTINIGTSNGNLDLGIYSYDGTTFTRVASLGSTASPGTGSRTFSISASLKRGVRYYAAFAADNATIATYNDASTNVPNPSTGLHFKASSFPLPATIESTTAMNAVNTVMPRFMGLPA